MLTACLGRLGFILGVMNNLLCVAHELNHCSNEKSQ